MFSLCNIWGFLFFIFRILIIKQHLKLTSPDTHLGEDGCQRPPGMLPPAHVAQLIKGRPGEENPAPSTADSGSP